MKVSKEHQEWIKQYAKSHNLTEEAALNKLIGDVRETQESERVSFATADYRKIAEFKS